MGTLHLVAIVVRQMNDFGWRFRATTMIRFTVFHGAESLIAETFRQTRLNDAY
jgi:hypothetical protein